jgi:hypothetical protein
MNKVRGGSSFHERDQRMEVLPRPEAAEARGWRSCHARWNRAGRRHPQFHPIALHAAMLQTVDREREYFLEAVQSLVSDVCTSRPHYREIGSG